MIVKEVKKSSPDGRKFFIVKAGVLLSTTTTFGLYSSQTG